MSSAGLFASSRRFTLTAADHRDIISARKGYGGVRPVSVQALANRYGVSMETISNIVLEAPAHPSLKAFLEPWPFAVCSETEKAIVRGVSEKTGVSLKRMTAPSGADKCAGKARAEAMYLLSEHGLGALQIGTIFGRDHSIVSINVSRHRKRLAAEHGE